MVFPVEVLRSTSMLVLAELLPFSKQLLHQHQSEPLSMPAWTLLEIFQAIAVQGV